MPGDCSNRDGAFAAPDCSLEEGFLVVQGEQLLMSSSQSRQVGWAQGPASLYTVQSHMHCMSYPLGLMKVNNV